MTSPLPAGANCFHQQNAAEGLDGNGDGIGGDDYNHPFVFLNGDANHDGRVNLDDFNILALNFSQGPRDFTEGDFNYDTLVNLSDFNILAARFGQVMAAPSVRGAIVSEVFDSDRREGDPLNELL